MSGVEEIIDLILSHASNLSRDDVLLMIKSKVQELGGLIDEEAAALLIAKELGVPIPKTEVVLRTAPLRIADLVPGLKGVNIVARVVKVYRSEGDKPPLRVLLADSTGVIWLSVWSRKCADVNLLPGDIVAVEGASTRKVRERVVLNLYEEGELKKINRSVDLPSLDEICKLFKLNTPLKLIIGYMVRDLNGNYCLYCKSASGKDVKVIVDEALASNLNEGDVFLLQDYTVLANTEELLTVRAKMNTRLVKIGSTSPPEIKLTCQPPSSLGKGEEVSVYGQVVAVVPFSKAGGAVYVTDGESYARIVAFSDETLLSLHEVSLKGSGIEIYGVRRGGDFLKITSGSWARPRDITIPRSTPRSFLRGPPGDVEVVAVLLSVKLRSKLVGDKVLLGLRARVDDGTGQAVIVTNKTEIISSLFEMGINELIDYAKEGSLEGLAEQIAKYMLVGREVEVKGRLLKGSLLAVDHLSKPL